LKEDPVGRKFTATPQRGVEGTIEEDGRQVPVMITLEGEIYEPGETLPPRVRTLGDWKRGRYWDALTSSLVIRVGDGVMTIGPDVLAGLPDSTPVRIGIKGAAIARR
jgi:hypothetical protein